MLKVPNLNSRVYIFIILIISSLKIIIYGLYKADIISFPIGGGNDADYYHSYALGEVNFSANIWSDILLFLNYYGLYNRQVISAVLFFINILVIPMLIVKTLKNVSSKVNNQSKILLIAILVVAIYPTLYFYTLDIYRDVFMVFCFLTTCLCVKKWIDSRGPILNIFWFSILMFLGFFLFKLRPYLGGAFFVSFLFFYIRVNRIELCILFFLYIFLLFIANFLGFFNSLIGYRGGFVETGGGSTLGLDFSEHAMFIPNFILSALGQLFGLYITNYISVLLFIIETAPVIFMSIYIFRNISYADKFLRFLLVFSIVYATIWLIGNDNLGTALRLRMYNYFAIYICFFSILAKKREVLSKI